jgi:hypothetical protein
MPIERFACLAFAAALMLALAGARLPPQWAGATHFLCFALATALLWRGTAGRARCAVVAAVVLAAAFVNFFAGAAAALAVATALFIRRQFLCAESSEP